MLVERSKGRKRPDDPDELPTLHRRRLTKSLGLVRLGRGTHLGRGEVGGATTGDLEDRTLSKIPEPRDLLNPKND